MSMPWPKLQYEDWKDTYATLHMWTQIVGKIRLDRMPWINHSWHVSLYVTSRGLTTSPMPYEKGMFQVDFDFIDHKLLVEASEGEIRRMDLRPMAVAAFYEELLAHLADLGIRVKIRTEPNEVPDPIPFDKDREHASYDRESVASCWKVLLNTSRVMHDFRAVFIGKCSPVHFFWGAFDLAVTRFSGRRAPRHPGGFPHLPDWVTREAYSHEVSSAGFWPGGGPIPEPVFYSYAYPEPQGFARAAVEPAAASYNTDLHEFVLPYEDVRTSGSPEKTLMSFFESTYAAAADLGGWDRSELERRGHPRDG